VGEALLGSVFDSVLNGVVPYLDDEVAEGLVDKGLDNAMGGGGVEGVQEAKSATGKALRKLKTLMDTEHKDWRSTMPDMENPSMGKDGRIGWVRKENRKLWAMGEQSPSGGGAGLMRASQKNANAFV
jgi:hypothetical protein